MSGVTAATATIENEVRDAPPDVRLEDDSTKQLERLKPLTDMLAGNRIGLLYRRWQVNPFARKGWNERMWGDGEEERDKLPALAGINWGHMYGAVGRWDKMSRVGAGISEGTVQASTALQAVWHGPAADAARDTFDELIGGATEFQDTAAWLASCIKGAWQTSREPVYDLGGFADSGWGAEFVSIYRGDNNEQQVGERSHDIDAFEAAAKKGITTLDQLKQTAHLDPMLAKIHWRFWVMGGYPKLLRNVRWLDDVCQRYCDVVRSLRERIRNTYKCVDENFRNLGDAMDSLGWAGGDKNANPFAKLAPPPQESPPPQSTDPDPDSGKPEQTGGPVDTGERPHNFGGRPDNYSKPAGAPGFVDPGAPPADPAQTDPAQVPVPTAAEPAPVRGAEDTVRITDGDRTISVTSPDGRGHVTVTVDDGTNPPKTYDLDLGGGEPSAAVPGEPARPPVASVGPQPISPRADGSCVVQDGPVTITAHRPPADPNTVVVTVDDGTGQPTTYTLDYDDPAGPVPSTAAAASATGFGGTASSPYAPGNLTGAVAGMGEAGLATASDDLGAGQSALPAAGMAEGGLPMVGGAGGGVGGGDSQRAAGSGWQRSGDLYDEDLPATLGVLGDDLDPDR